MRIFLFILSCFITTLTFSQTLTDKYLHFKTDYYWDTILYQSRQDFYYEINKGTITEKQYPVLHYLFTKIISDDPLVTIDSFERHGFADYPYKYTRKGKNIFLRYFDLEKHKPVLHKEYSLIQNDTVEWLANKKSLDSKNGISVSGYSTYSGEVIIEINGRQFNTFGFTEDHYESGSHPDYYTKEVYLEQATLIPVKFITTGYNYKTRKKKLYHSVTILTSSGQTLPDYTNMKSADLVLYEDKSINWTGQQKEEFLKMFPSGMKQYGECLLKKSDGHLSFFHIEQTTYFRKLLVSNECE